MFLCCQSSVDLSPCYASVLVCGTLSVREAISNIEKKGLCPCVTGWCNYHHQLSMIGPDTLSEADGFPCWSAFYAHIIATEKKNLTLSFV